jgi:hypothetical protein
MSKRTMMIHRKFTYSLLVQVMLKKIIIIIPILCNATHGRHPFARTQEATFTPDLRLAHVIRRPKRLLHAQGTRVHYS